MPVPFAVLMLLSMTVMPLYADIFDDPKNLKILPTDISARDLSATMRAFSLGTGVRCSGCHVGEEDQDLDEYDFESDQKELKKKARLMLEMVNSINGDHLDAIDKDHVTVRCVTCHRGVQKPKLLGQVLADAASQNGAVGVRESYTKLREKYYGSHSYDFTESTLAQFARSQGVAGNMAAASVMLDIMLEENPESFQALWLYGELSFKAGDMNQARHYLKSALKINPRANFIIRRLEQIKAQSNKS